MLAWAALVWAHAVLCGSVARCGQARRPVRFYDIDKRMFAVNIASMDVPRDVNDINVYAKGVSDTLYECAGKSWRTREGKVNSSEALK